MSQRVELRGNRHILVGFGDDCRFACERIAHECQLVARAHEESEEAVEVVEGVLQGGFQAVSRRQTPVQVTTGGLRVTITLEALAEFFQLAAQATGVGERAVVYETPVLTGRVGMGILERNRRLGCHSRVTNQMRAAEMAKAVTIRNLR